MKLSETFYQRDDVVQLSRELLGKYLFTNLNGELTGGKIIETEAYKGPEDRACHAYNNRRTKRTEVMFQNGGVSYVYLCYGLHYLFNIVTGPIDFPHAILIRAIEPLVGIPRMLIRRKKKFADKTLANGPGSTAQCLGIDGDLNRVSLLGDLIWIEERELSPLDSNIQALPRVGIDYAGEDAKLPWRFILKYD